MTIRARALAHVGAAETSRAPLEPPAGCHPFDRVMWRCVVSSLETLAPLGVDGEQPLLDSYVDAHIRILETIAERRS